LAFVERFPCHTLTCCILDWAVELMARWSFMAGHGQGRPAGAAARSKGATGGWEAFRRCYLRIFGGGEKVVIVAFERIWLKSHGIERCARQ
jgi:hypothetical protein